MDVEGLIAKFDSLAAEQKELDVMVREGLEFRLPMKSPLKYLRKKDKRERVWVLPELYTGTVDYLSHAFAKIEFNERKLQDNPLAESKLLAGRSAKLTSRIVAMAVLNDEWGIRFLTPFLARYFLWRIKPSKLWRLAMMVNVMMNLEDFTNSIRLFAIVLKSATPERMEENQEGV